MQEQLKILRNDLETSQVDLRTLREREEQWDANRFQLESKLRDKESETQRLHLLQTNLENEKQVKKFNFFNLLSVKNLIFHHYHIISRFTTDAISNQIYTQLYSSSKKKIEIFSR